MKAMKIANRNFWGTFVGKEHLMPAYKDAKQSGLCRWAAVLLLALAVTGPSFAESPWQRLSRAISPKAKLDAAELAADGVRQQRDDAGNAMIAAEVPNEGTADVAYAAETGGGMTGLALAGGKGAGGVDLGREVDENATMFATDLFKNAEILRMLGDRPRFVYQTNNRPDPMLVPWVRNQAIYNELSSQADALVEQGNVDGAVELYQRILAMNDIRFDALVRAKLTEISATQQQKDLALAETQPASEIVELPPWVYDNTNGVIIDPGKDLCLVGEYLLKKGDALPNYPDIFIDTISGKKVSYRYKDKTFEVALKDE
jgi:hypothetical protein